LTHNVTRNVGDGDFAWMPDGRSFVFVRTVKKQKPQLYRYTLADGTVVQLTHVKDGVSAPVVSHAGDRIALTVTETDPAHDAYVDFKNAGFTPASSQKKSDVHVIDQLFFETNASTGLSGHRIGESILVVLVAEVQAGEVFFDRNFEVRHFSDGQRCVNADLILATPACELILRHTHNNPIGLELDLHRLGVRTDLKRVNQTRVGAGGK
jgi:glyoxylate utilization-related uncharacterized protein